MTDPILLFLTVDIASLLLLGGISGVLPPAAGSFLTVILCGLGALLCLPPLLIAVSAAELRLPIGPPGFSLQIAIDPLSAFFLLLIFVSGTAIAAFQSIIRPTAQASSVGSAAFSLAGIAVTLLSADAVSLAVGTAIATGTIFLSRGDPRNHAVLAVPLLLLAAICLLTPIAADPRFAVIRAASIDPSRALIAAVLTVGAAIALVCCQPRPGCWTRAALAATALPPAGVYLLLRIVAGLCAPAVQSWWGSILLLAGSAIALSQGWRSACHPDMEGSVASLIRRQAGLAIIGIGLMLIARFADLPEAQSFALAAVLLLTIGSGFAGTLATLAVHAISTRAGTSRLSRLGGLIHTMPTTSGACSAALLALSALPPGLGFVCLWLSFQSILAAPRSGGLPAQLPLALTAATLALSAATATAASVRLIGIGILGRPRSPGAAAATESPRPIRVILLALTAVSLVPGLLPGPLLWLLAGSTMRLVIGMQPRVTFYPALPVLAVPLVSALGIVLLLRWRSRETKPAGAWFGGMQHPAQLPFGDAAAQAGPVGFLPKLPTIRWPELPGLPSFPATGRLSAAAGLWIVLGVFGLVLLLLAVRE